MHRRVSLYRASAPHGRHPPGIPSIRWETEDQLMEKFVRMLRQETGISVCSRGTASSGSRPWGGETEDQLMEKFVRMHRQSGVRLTRGLFIIQSVVSGLKSRACPVFASHAGLNIAGPSLKSGLNNYQSD